MKNENEVLIANLVQKGFAEHYRDGSAPWDIGRSKPPFVEIADQVLAPVLDAGCGTGDNSIYFASRGLKVIGIDFVDEAILKAKSKANGRNLPVEFLVQDAVELGKWHLKFNSVIDSGLFHCCYNKQKYISGLKHILNPGGYLFLLYFKDDPSSPDGGISENELKEFFAGGWEIKSIKSLELSEQDTGDWKMNFAIIQKQI